MPPASKNTEYELLQKIRKGNEPAFRALYDLYHAALFRNVIRLVHSTAEAQDIIQEVFIALWEHRQSLDIERPVNGWLFTLSYHRTVNHLRKKLTEQRTRQLLTDLSFREPEAAVDEGLITAQWQLMEEAMSHLSPQKRKVFELCKLEGNSYEKAAGEMGISRHTVAEYLQEAMAFIREYIGQRPLYSSSSLALVVLDLFLK